MPELPEVETFARTLRPDLIGRTILDADVRWRRTVASPSVRDFKEQIRGQEIRGVNRRAKFLVLELSSLTLLLHLRMSGDLRIEPAPLKPRKHDRLILTLADGRTRPQQPPTHLIFNDTRKFGRVWLTPDVDDVTGDLGPEPLSDDFTSRELYQRLHDRRRLLKPLLLDQTFLAGLGNIYTDEALNLARLHPLARSDSISRAQAHRLHTAIQSILRQGISQNGASIDWVYRGGDFQNHFRVYDRKGKPCPRCGTRIRRLLVGQRSTHICPKCQKV